MALNAYLKIKGEQQGDIAGSVTQAGREEQIAVYGWSHEVVSPRDAATGHMSGKRQHAPFTIVKPVDKASVPLMTSLVMNEPLTVTLRAWRASPTGREEQYYTITLANATVSQLQSEMLNNQYPENAKHEVREHISFTYQKITWTWESGGITLEDSWASELEG
jgi:type VI secretion system secreted protein Hcp